MKFILIISLLFSTATAQNKFFFALNKTGITIGGGTTGLFAFTLAAPAHTSAGVFKNDSILVRTLWSDSVISAGTKTAKWDGTDDYGNAIASPAATYKIKVLSNNVQYTWQGTVGNSSDSMTGSTKHRGYNNAMVGMALGSTYGYYCTGYSELTSSLKKFNLATPQQAIPLFNAASLTGDVKYVVTDGTKVYWALMDGFSYTNSMVMATYTADDTEVPFTSGQYYHFAFGNTSSNFNYVISKVDTANSVITGLAVQQTGNYLFVARAGYVNKGLLVYNKTTGALAQTLSFAGCKGLSVDPTNDNLWIIQGTTATKYGVNTNGTLTAAIVAISGLTNPLSTQVSPDGSLVAICDAGTSQQVKFFNNTTGAATNTLGTAGGYFSDASVTDYKFYFSDVIGDRIPFVKFKSDGSFWVNDPGNQRTQLYTASRVYSSRISFLGGTYSTWADKNNITKVFGGYLEFAVDYSVQTLTGSTGWLLAKNWGANITTAYDVFATMRYETTLSNGRTYGILRNGSQLEVVELPSTGQLRFTGVMLSSTKFLCSDGSLQDYTTAGLTHTYLRYPLSGFDGSNNPLWSATAEVLATAVKDTIIGNQVGGPASQIFSNSTNKIAFFDYGTYITVATKLNKGYHLGVMSRAANNIFLSQTEMATHRNYGGAYPKAGRYDIGNGVNQNSGANVNIIDRYILTTYHGEFWKDGQTNKGNLYLDNGLAIGQFGTTRTDVGFTSLAAAGMAGNALYPVLVKDTSGNLYVYHGDESDHSGIHRWKISGLNTIAEQVITIPFPSSYTAPVINYTSLMTGLPFDAPLVNNIAGWTRSPTTESAAWKINTSRLTYDSKDRDLLVEFNPTGATTNTLSRDLGTNTVVNDWAISGDIYFGGSPIYNTAPVSLNFQVLDSAGKTLTDFYVQQSGTYPVYTTSVKGNTTTLYTKTETGSPTVDSLIGRLAPFNFTFNAGAVIFSYSNLASVSTTIMDATGNGRKPKTLRVICVHDGSAYPIYSRSIDISNLKFYKDIL